MKRTPPTPKSRAAAQKAATQRAALNALKRAKRLALRTGAELSDWEGEFLGSLEARIKTFGRAFADPDKGSPGEALSIRQRLKLKEIAAKAKGEEPRAKWRGRARRVTPGET